MPRETQRTPFDVTFNLSTPGLPITYREQVQDGFRDGAEFVPIGPPRIEIGEFRGSAAEALVAAGLVAAQRQASDDAAAKTAAIAEKSAAVEALADERGRAANEAESLRAALAAKRAEAAALQADLAEAGKIGAKGR